MISLYDPSIYFSLEKACRFPRDYINAIINLEYFRKFGNSDNNCSLFELIKKLNFERSWVFLLSKET